MLDRAADGALHRPQLPRRGWGILAVLAPHCALGTWLVLVPDRVAFTATQLSVIAHVLAGLATLPLFCFWLWQHALGRLLGRDPRRKKDSATAISVRHLLALLCLLAFASGLSALWSGEGGRFSSLHRALGLLPSLPLALHLFLEGRRKAAALVLASLFVATGGACLARDEMVGEAEFPASPRFSPTERPTALYEPASFCGECHTDVYEEWSHSTHARAIVLPSVRGDFEQTMRDHGVGRVDRHLAEFRAPTSNEGLCTHCHTPLTFYGDDTTPVLAAKSPVTDGVSCSFCHTLRGTRNTLAPLPPFWNPFTEDIDFYVSAPETVRRYIGQGSSSRFLHALGNLLIRWRPEMHRRDYHSPFLDGSRACMGCHSFLSGVSPFREWTKSRFDTGDPKTTANCQDCHMTKEMTGRPVDEPGRMVPWGRERAQRRNHLFLGGNVQAALQLKDAAMARDEHEMARRGLRLHVDSAVLSGDALAVKVTVESVLVGHRFPTGEAAARIAWLTLVALDADGNVLAKTERETQQLPVPAASHSATIERGLEISRSQRGDVVRDTTIPADGRRSFESQLIVFDKSKRVARLRVELHTAFDETPIAVVEEALATSDPIAPHR